MYPNLIFFSRNVLLHVAAVRLDGCDVIGYTAWSLLDNFEWERGYSERFGIHHVDFSDPKRRRREKMSADYFSKLVQQNGFLKEH